MLSSIVRDEDIPGRFTLIAFNSIFKFVTFQCKILKLIFLQSENNVEITALNFQSTVLFLCRHRRHDLFSNNFLYLYTSNTHAWNFRTYREYEQIDS